MNKWCLDAVLVYACEIFHKLFMSYFSGELVWKYPHFWQPENSNPTIFFHPNTKNNLQNTHFEQDRQTPDHEKAPQNQS